MVHLVAVEEQCSSGLQLSSCNGYIDGWSSQSLTPLPCWWWGSCVGQVKLERDSRWHLHSSWFLFPFSHVIILDCFIGRCWLVIHVLGSVLLIEVEILTAEWGRFSHWRCTRCILDVSIIHPWCKERHLRGFAPGMGAGSSNPGAAATFLPSPVISQPRLDEASSFVPT